MRTTAAILIAALVLVVKTPVANAAADNLENLAPNPGFETSDGTQPAFWAQRTPTDTQRSLSWDNNVFRSGKWSAKIENRASDLSRWRTGHLRDLVLQPGTECCLTGWIKTKDVKGDAHLQLYFIDSGGQILAQPTSSAKPGTNDWTRVQLPTVVPKRTAYVMIYLGLRDTGTAWFDDIVLSGEPGKGSVNMDVPAVTYNAVDFYCLEGYTVKRHGRRLALELGPGAKAGRAEAVFWGESARYNLTFAYAGRGGGPCRLLVAGKERVQWTFGSSPDDPKRKDGLREHVVTDVDVQRLSRVVLERTAGQPKSARVYEVRFTPAGRFQGTFLPADQLRVPPTFRLYEDLAQRRQARRMLSAFIGQRVARLTEQRAEELAGLKTPDVWRRRQEQTRARLVEFLGDFEPKCPLNAKIVGRLDQPDYVIEKLIFESQPAYYCTANFYVPKRRKFPAPGVIFTCGHAREGKAYHLYHEACLGLVLKGYVVLGLDPTGQGERSEYFDPETLKDLVPRTVSQHHYLARPSWLVGRSLAGYRTWDCIRAVDYLVTRPEVDPQQIAAVGNSGGGQMALLITAADQRVKVCAAAHPGGSMENTYLTGQSIIDREVLSLIPPRPCAFVVGKDSGEEPGHRARLNDMLLFYEGLGVDKNRGQMLIVDGVHNMKQPKREASYAWLNRWLGKESEGAEEPPLKPETVEDLHCTEHGYVLKDIGGETGQTLNAKLAEKLRPPRPVPPERKAIDTARAALKNTIAKRIGLSIPENRKPPLTTARGTVEQDQFTAEKLLLESEEGIILPSLLLMPKKDKRSRPVLIHVAELGKPTGPTPPALALELVRAGHTVLSVDVRGAGETDPRVRSALPPLTHYDASQFRFDSCAVGAATLGTTMLAMRAGDVIRAIDYLAGHKDLSGRGIVLVGEGLGGVWVLTAAAFDDRVRGIVCVKTVPSYKLIAGSQYYNARDYFWINGALKDFDLPDLVGLIAPRPTLLVDPVDAMLEPLEEKPCEVLCEWPRGIYQALAAPQAFKVMRTADGTAAQIAGQVAAALATVKL